MRFFVKTQYCKVIPFDEDLSLTVDRLKTKICIKEGIPVEQQRLVFSGKLMKDDAKSLADYGIRYEASIYLVLKMTG